ncbi:MAG: hypothetical protein AAAB35_04760 [Phyllobacterium sp.]|uniref:hypothetical protein n=1 Tax=Phyllobacterium sp. TaxID=1871046 RepID=UPI0030F2DD47
MITFQIVFLLTGFLTIFCALTAAAIVGFGDTRRNNGQRVVAETFAQIALIGAAAVASLLVVRV